MIAKHHYCPTFQGLGSARFLAAAVGHAVNMSLAIGQLARLFTRACLNLVNSRSSWEQVLRLNHEALAEVAF